MKREEEEDASKNVNGSNINSDDSDDIKLASKQKQSVPKCHIWFRALPSFLPSSRRHVSSRLLSVSALFFLSEKKNGNQRKTEANTFPSHPSIFPPFLSFFLQACAEFMESILSVDNCLRIRSLGELYSQPQLTADASLFIQVSLTQQIAGDMHSSTTYAHWRWSHACLSVFF